MIAGWSKLQFPLGHDSLGKGAFTLAPPSITSSSASKEQKLSVCRSYGDRGGVEPHNESFFFPDVKASLVENLVGALINATEILDVHPSGASAAFKGLLGFEAASQDHVLVLATGPSHALPHCEPLQLLSPERLSYGSSAHAQFSSLHRRVFSSSNGSLRLASNAHAHHSVQTYSALRSGGASHGHRDLSVNIERSADHGHSHHRNQPATSEEDLLLQEARFKDFKSRTEPDGWKNSRQASASSDGLMKTVVPLRSTQAKDVSDRESLIAHAEAGKPWSFAEVTTLSRQNSLFWGGIVLSMLLTGALFVTCRSTFPLGKQLRRPSIKRRILKSQWYGSPGSQSWDDKNFQMRISEFPKYPMLEVDGDKKLLRVPSDSNGSSAAFVKRGSHLPGATNAAQGQPIRQTIHGTSHDQVSNPKRAGGPPIRQTIHGATHDQVSNPKMAQGQPIRQTIYGSKVLPARQQRLNKAQPHRDSNGKALSDVVWTRFAKDRQETWEDERNSNYVQPRLVPVINKAPKITSHEKVPLGGLYGRRLQDSVQDNNSKQRSSKSRIDQSHWGKEDEVDLDKRIQKLYQTIQAVEQNRRAAMLALEEEKQRSLALEEEMMKQREASAMLGEEVRLLKESHNALLASLRKKYSTSAAARTAADLVYQDWERHAAAE